MAEHFRVRWSPFRNWWNGVLWWRGVVPVPRLCDADARLTAVLTMACIGRRGRLCAARIQEKLCQWGQTTQNRKKSYLCSKYGAFYGSNNNVIETRQVS